LSMPTVRNIKGGGEMKRKIAVEIDVNGQYPEKICHKYCAFDTGTENCYLFGERDWDNIYYLHRYKRHEDCLRAEVVNESTR
jgi:hypothetical protein